MGLLFIFFFFGGGVGGLLPRNLCWSVCFVYCTYQCKAREGGGMGKGWGFLSATQTFCQNACGLGIEKSSNDVQGPHPRNTK